MSADHTDTAASAFPSVVGYEIHAVGRRDRLGVVYRARQVLHGREVALRLVDEQIAGHDLTHVCKVARQAALAVHPPLLALLEVGESDGSLYLASELATGPSLRERLAAGVFPPAEAAALVAGVARAVHQLHEHHALHLGLTSAGIFLASDGSPRVGDAGLSELLHDRPGSPFPGDRAYAAPEQLAMKKADARADVYALGCLLQECLMGSPSTPVAGRPATLERICRKALATRPERRHVSAADMASELERFQHGEAPAPGIIARLSAFARVWAAALLAALVLVVGGSIAMFAILTGRQATLTAEVERWRHQAELAGQEGREARDQRDQAARRDTQKVRAAEDRVRQANGERDEHHKRALDEERLRKAAEKQNADAGRERTRAEERARDAEAARVAAAALRTEAVRQLARLYVGQGSALLNTGDLTGALVPFVRALSAAHDEKLPEDAHRLRIAALLSRCPRPMTIQCFKKGDVNSMQLSRNGQYMLIVGADGVIVVRNARTGKLVGKRLVHGAAVAAAVLSPDGLRVLSADAMGQLRMWKTEDGSAVFEPVALDAVPTYLAFSGDGKRFVAISPGMMADDEISAQVYDAATGETIGEAITALVAPQPACLSPDGKQLLLCCTDRTARAYDVATGKQLGGALEHPRDVVSAIYSADGRLILTFCADETARVWSAETGKPILASLAHGMPSIPPQLDESGRLVLTAGKDGMVRIHDITTGKPVGPALRTRAELRQAVLSPDGRFVLLARSDGVVTMHALTQASRLFILPPLFHAGPLPYLAIAPDSSRALTFDGRTLRVWDLTPGEPLAPAGPLTEPGAVWNGDVTRFARIQGDSVQLYDSAGKALGEAMKHKGEVQRVVFSPEGDLVLTTSNPLDATAGTPTWDVRVWDTKTGKPVSEVMEHLREVTQATFAGSRVLTVALDKRVRLWDARTGKLIGKPRDHAQDVILAAVSPDGRRVVTCDKEGMTRTWDAETGDRVGDGMGYPRAVRYLTFSADGKALATCFEDGVVRAWELDTGRQLMQAEHGDVATHASFSPDGKLLLTAGADGMARLWTVATGKPATPPLLHGEAVQRTAFSTDGRWLLTAAGPVVRIWDAANGEPISPPLLHSTDGSAVTFMALSKTGELTTATGPGTRWTRTLIADARLESDLADLARVISGREEAGAGQLAPVAVRELETAWDHVTARYPKEFEPHRPRQIAWARRGAAECEARELWAGVVRHLDVLLKESLNAPLLARRGKARNRLHEYEGALADYSAALKADPRRWDWWLGRADAAAALGRWEQVVADCTKAAEQDGRHGEVWQRLGRAEAQRGEWKKAADALTKAVRFGAEEPVAWYELALTQLSAGDEKGYRRTCARMVKKYGDAEDAAVRRLVAEACVLGPDAIADFKTLVARAEKAVRETPTDVSERVRLGALYLRAGQFARAIAVLERCIDKDQPRLAAAWLLAVAYQKNGANERAKSAHDQAAKTKERTGTQWHERQTERLWRKEAEAAMKGMR